MNKILFSFIALLLLGSPALSQDTSEPSNASQPVEATADDLQVNNETNIAIFTGNANVIQGILNLQADKITVQNSLCRWPSEFHQRFGNCRVPKSQF